MDEGAKGWKLICIHKHHFTFVLISIQSNPFFPALCSGDAARLLNMNRLGAGVISAQSAAAQESCLHPSTNMSASFEGRKQLFTIPLRSQECGRRTPSRQRACLQSTLRLHKEESNHVFAQIGGPLPHYSSPLLPWTRWDDPAPVPFKRVIWMCAAVCGNRNGFVYVCCRSSQECPWAEI